MIYRKHIEAINIIPLREKDFIVVLGDFNIPHSTWNQDNMNSNIMVPTAIKPEHCAEFIDELLSLGLGQINNVFNSKNRLLDLLFSNE